MLNKTVLVLDANQRSALAVTRSLGCLSGIALITADSSDSSLAGSSRFSQRYICSPSSKAEPQQYVSWLAGVVKDYGVDLVLPVTEITSQLLLINKTDLPEVHLPFPAYEQVMAIADKGSLVKAAMAVDIPVPESQFYDKAEALDVGLLSFPCVIKPCLSHIYTGDAWVSTTVRVIDDLEQLETCLADDTYLQTHPFMVQEFIPGHGGGVFCFYEQGQFKVAFAHERLREKPPAGGVSVLSQSVDIDPELLSYAKALLDHVQWHGVAMVEFRIDEQGKPFLMEINTRFWGSLQLAIDAGVDFPRYVLEAELAGAVAENDRKQNKPYRREQRLRWLLGDLDSLYLVLKSNKYSWGFKLRRVFAFVFTSPFKTRFEVNRWGDLGPAKFELKQYLKSLVGK